MELHTGPLEPPEKSNAPFSPLLPPAVMMNTPLAAILSVTTVQGF